MNNVHEDETVVFTTRWAMSYLCGPLTKNQIKILMQNKKAEYAGVEQTTRQLTPEPAPVSAGSISVVKTQPVLPPEISQYFMPVKRMKPEGVDMVYHPMIIG